MNIPAVQRRLKEVGTEPASSDRRSPEYLQEFVASETKKWAAAIKTAGVRID
jgi:tripartite-type tricarboxylate transporter receptor subunit TctC